MTRTSDREKPATPSAPKRPSQYQLAAGVARHVELRNVLLRSVSAALRMPHADASALIETEKTDANVKFTPSFSLDDTGLGIVVVIEFEISITTGDPPSDVLNVNAAFELSYGLDSAPPAEHRDLLLGAFAHMNGTYNAWPYLRELVQSTTARMSLPPVVLPVFRVPADSPRAIGADNGALGTGTTSTQSQ